MADIECGILTRLEGGDDGANVPTVIAFIGTTGFNALIVSPVGDPVLPCPPTAQITQLC